MPEVPRISRDQWVAIRHGCSGDQHVPVAGRLAHLLEKTGEETEEPRRRVSELQNLESTQ